MFFFSFEDNFVVNVITGKDLGIIDHKMVCFTLKFLKLIAKSCRIQNLKFRRADFQKLCFPLG